MASLLMCATRVGCSVLLLGALVGCSSDGDKPAARDGGTGDARDPSQVRDANVEAGAEASSADAGKGFRAQLRASSGARVLCPGACTELSASAEQGTEPYTFRFDHGLGSGAGPHRVCPPETTTYEVSVSDSSFEGEFGGKNADATARVTIAVGPACDADAGGGADASIDAPRANDAASDSDALTGAPDAGPGGSATVKAFCTQQLARIDKASIPGSGDATFDTFSRPFKQSVAIDPQGRVVFATNHHSTLQLLDGTQLSGRYDAVLVGTLTSDCKPVWFKSLAGLGSLGVHQMAVDSKGRIVVLGSSRDQSTGQSAIYLAALSPAGELLWEKFFDGGSTGIYGLRIDANDDAVILVSATPGTNFGGASLGSPFGARDPGVGVLAKYRASNGSHVWSKLVSDIGSNASLAIQNGTDIVFHGWSDISRNWGAGGRTMGASTGAHGYLVRADAAGNFSWSLVTSEGDAEMVSFHALDANRAGHLLLSNVGATGELALANSNAQVQWHKRVIGSTAPEHAFDWAKVAVDAQGDIFLGGNFEGSTTVNGYNLSVRQSDGSDAFVQQLDVNGDVRWTYQVDDLGKGAPSSELTLGVAGDGKGNGYALVNAMGREEYGLWIVGIGR